MIAKNRTERGASTMQSVVFILVAVAGLVLIYKYLIASKAVPSLSEFMASSTEQASSDYASSTSDEETTSSATSALPYSSYEKTDIVAPKGTIHALVSDTADKMELGLSFRDSIPSDEGMLFKFDTADTYQFWMKDMSFPLDIVWIKADKSVAGVTPNLTPDTYPETFIAPAQVLYVLEVPAGDAARFGIATGTVLSF